MFCRYCGNQLPDDAAFCNKCGRRVALSVPQPPSTKVTREFETHSAFPEQSQSNPGYQPTVPAWPLSQPSYSGQEQPMGAQSPLILPPPPTSQPWMPPSQSMQHGTLSSTPLPQSSMPVWQQPPGSQSQWSMPQGSTSQPGWQPWQMPGAPPQAIPPGAMQQLLLRIFKPALAGNALFGIVLGSSVSLVLGASIACLLVAITHAIAPPFNRGGVSGRDIMDYILGIVPLHSPFRDGLQLLFIMQGAVLHTQYTSGSSVFSYTYSVALNGLLLIPALALTFGGYIAASTDLQNHAINSLWRGAAIAIPYAILLLILLPQVNGSIPLLPGESTSDVNTLSVDAISLFVFGLLWGALFGLLGASLKLGRGHWRKMVLQYLRTRSRPQIGGMIAGGLTATSLGFSLSFLVLLSILAYSAYSVPVFTNNLCYFNFGYGNWQFMSAWGIAQGPLHALNLFFYSFGAPITINNPQPFGQSCFYTASSNLRLTMFGGSPHLPSWTYALLALPIISLFLGGRVSAAIGRSQGVGPGAIQGAIIALPFMILMMLLSVITTITSQNTGPFGGSSTPTTFVQSAGAGAFDLALWALLSGAALGAIGGMYQTSALKTNVGKAITSVLKAPIWLLAKPGFLLIDRLRGRPHRAPQTAALSLLYAAVMSAILLTIAVGAAAAVFIALNQAISFDLNYHIRDILGVILVALPGLLLVSAAASALSEDPSPGTQNIIPAFPGAFTVPGIS